MTRLKLFLRAQLKLSLVTTSDLLQITNHTLIILYLILSVSFAHNTSVSLYHILFLFILFFCDWLLHVNHVQLFAHSSLYSHAFLIFNSTAYCHAHSFIFYILFFISYFLFILFYVYFPCVVFSIFALSKERTRLSFHCWLYNLCIPVYVTNKT